MQRHEWQMLAHRRAVQSWFPNPAPFVSSAPDRVGRQLFDIFRNIGRIERTPNLCKLTQLGQIFPPRLAQKCVAMMSETPDLQRFGNQPSLAVKFAKNDLEGGPFATCNIVCRAAGK